MRRIILLILSTVLLFSGCAAKSVKSVSTAELSETTETVIEEIPPESTEEINIEPTEESTQLNAQNTYVEIPEGALSQEKSAELLIQRLESYGMYEDDQHISYEGTVIINYREFYMFRRYNDVDDHRVTIGRYAVNPVTGECLDTTTEPMPLYYRFEIAESGTEEVEFE